MFTTDCIKIEAVNKYISIELKKVNLLIDKSFKIKHLNRLLFLYFVRVRYFIMGTYMVVGISCLIVGILIGLKIKGKVFIGGKQNITQTFNDD